jgi:hypothetical protein
MPECEAIVPSGNISNPKFIINFPTMSHWKEKSKIDVIKIGLEALIADLQEFNLQLAWKAGVRLLRGAISLTPTSPGVCYVRK